MAVNASAWCPPGWSTTTMYISVGSCEAYADADVCYRYRQGPPEFLDIIVQDIRMSGSCNCITRSSLILAANQDIVNNVINHYNSSNPPIPIVIGPCPSDEFVSRLYPAACATDCINTGDIESWPNGGTGAVWKSWACEADLACRYTYTVCCPSSIGPCPPNDYLTTFVDYEVLNEGSPCGTTTVFYTNCLTPLTGCELECKPQCP